MGIAYRRERFFTHRVCHRELLDDLHELFVAYTPLQMPSYVSNEEQLGTALVSRRLVCILYRSFAVCENFTSSPSIALAQVCDLKSSRRFSRFMSLYARTNSSVIGR